MHKKQIGVIGMAVMGRNLAINIANKGYEVAIFNRSSQKTNEVIYANPNKKITPYFSLQEFINSLKKPRCILLMVKAGYPTDQMINYLIPYLNKGDILIDGGNSYYQDTIDRYKKLNEHGIYFIGAGISGGEEGALNGPSIMPGGSKSAYLAISPILKKIAANFDHEPCVTYIGSDGAGHYVKMIHNGIEYGDMQLIGESYYLLKSCLLLDNKDLASVFQSWGQGELNSYLIEITAKIFKKQDNNNNYLIDLILDEADNKGTGKWISQDALEIGEPLSLITNSVFARYLSVLKHQRIQAFKILKGPKLKIITKDKDNFIEKVRRSLYLGKIISYAQGFSQLKTAAQKNKWQLNFAAIAKIFRAGCIIRAQLLQKIVHTYDKDINTINLLLSPNFANIANQYQKELREITSYAIQNGLAVPAFSAAISYYDSYRSSVLPANSLIQAQRDYFGAHTYKRIDKQGIFHSDWLNKTLK